MIDFRYHMVSLAAVLIALSMGIVLGAGPLNDDIGNTLTNEVDRLRQDKADLRSQLDEQQRGTEARESFEAQVLPQLVQGTLDGQRVALVQLPEADDAAVDSLGRTLEDAGAHVGPTISVNATWVATGQDAQKSRDEVTAQALGDLGRPASSSADLDSVLGVVVGGRTGDGSPSPSVDQCKAALERLTDGGLVSTSDDISETADLVVVVGGPVSADGTNGEKTARTEATAWVELSRAIDERSGGVVLLADEAASGSSDVSPVRAARADSGLGEGVSTVDTADTSLGRAATVLALVEQRAGDAGHYGLGEDAGSAVPAAS